MLTLEEKLATLSNGTEAVAAVLSNWHNVLRAINMASMHLPNAKTDGAEAEKEDPKKPETEVPLPQTLVRIPTEQPSQELDPQSTSGSGGGGA